MGAILQRVLVIGGEPKVWEKLKPFLLDENWVGEMRRVDHYPSPEELARVARLFPPDIVFLGLESAPAAFLVMAELELHAAGAPVVAFNRLDDSRAVTEWMRAGVREIVKQPFDREQLEEILRRMASLAERRKPSRVLPNLCAFLPARGGAGTSTLACHLALTLAAELPSRVLLADLDLVSSSLRYLLNLNQGQTIRDAAECLDGMDDWRWNQIVAHVEQLDVLSAGGLNPRRPLRTERVRQLLDYTSTQYQVICADLSGNMEVSSLEVLRSAGAVFVVTTPDAPSLGAARDKAEFLDSIGLKSRTALLIRQAPQTTIPPAAQIERFCGLPVSGVFDYTEFRAGRKSEEDTRTVLPTTLRKQLVQFARSIVETARKPVLQQPAPNPSAAASCA